MVVLSFLLVIVAAVTLVIGLFQDTLAWIWTSIASCVVAMIFLGVGVLQRRGRQEEAVGEASYGPGVAAAPTAATGGGRTGTADIDVVPKRTAGEARAAVEESAGDVATAAEAARAPEPAAAPAPADAPEPAAVPTTEEPFAAEVAEPAEAAAAETAPPATSATATRASETPAATGTTGARARAELASVKGLGPAKQNALLEHFGSLEAIAAASKRELTEVKGIGDRVADEIKSTLG